MQHARTIAAVAAAVLFSATSLAQTPATPPASQTPMARPGMSAPNHDSGAFSGWMNDYQSKNQGRISRQAYMDEVGRRWDQADTNKQGLTTDQINRAYGYGGTGAIVNTTPGNMGPQNVKK